MDISRQKLTLVGFCRGKSDLVVNNIMHLYNSYVNCKNRGIPKNDLFRKLDKVVLLEFYLTIITRCIKWVYFIIRLFD